MIYTVATAAHKYTYMHACISYVFVCVHDYVASCMCSYDAHSIHRGRWTGPADPVAARPIIHGWWS